MPLWGGEALAQWTRDLSPWSEGLMGSDTAHSLYCAIKQMVDQLLRICLSCTSQKPRIHPWQFHLPPCSLSHLLWTYKISHLRCLISITSYCMIPGFHISPSSICLHIAAKVNNQIITLPPSYNTYTTDSEQFDPLISVTLIFHQVFPSFFLF